MKPVEISGPNGVVARQVATAAMPARAAEPVRPVRLENGESHAAESVVVRSAGESAPVDSNRVSEIRRAIEDGSYPLTPTRIADAIIAAGFLLRVK